MFGPLYRTKTCQNIDFLPKSEPVFDALLQTNLAKSVAIVKTFQILRRKWFENVFFSQNAGICLFTIFSSAPQISMTFNLVPKISTEFEIYKLSRIKYLVVSANMRTCIVQKYNISIIIMLWCSGSGTVDIARIWRSNTIIPPLLCAILFYPSECG